MSYIPGAHNTKSKCCYHAKPSAYCLYVKTKISVDFQTCISVLLRCKSLATWYAISLFESNLQ